MVVLKIFGIDTRYYHNNDVDLVLKKAERFNRITGKYVSVYQEELILYLEEKEKTKIG